MKNTLNTLQGYCVFSPPSPYNTKRETISKIFGTVNKKILAILPNVKNYKLREEGVCQADYGKVFKNCSTNLSKLTFSGNFTKGHKLFDINSPERRASMRKDIIDTVMKRTESIIEHNGDQPEFDDNPLYEDPRDVIGQKPAKPPRKRNLQGIAVTSPRLSKDGKSLLREQKKKLTKKYESLITTLMDRCEENVVMMSEKDATITKLKEKLKTVLEYNKLFAEENDQLKTQYTTLVSYVEECKQAVKGERERNRELEGRCKELEEKVKQYEVPDREFPQQPTAIPLVEVCMSCSSRQIVLQQAREQNCRLQKDMQAMKEVLYSVQPTAIPLVKVCMSCSSRQIVFQHAREPNCRLQKDMQAMKDVLYSVQPTAIPLVEVCMSCSSRQIVLQQAREQNCRLQKDMQAMKDVLHRLNVQLSRYQEKLRNMTQNMADGKGDFIHKPSDNLDSLINVSLGFKGTEPNADDTYTKSAADEQTHTRLVDLCGLLSAQALAPLFDAYQENLQEKESLILDYEKQFEAINKKSKQIVEENKSLADKVAVLEEELAQVRQGYKKLAVERETTDIERATLVERAVKAENKLKEVYEMYEDKMSAIMRDYETVHREYFTVKSTLEATEGKLAQLDVLRTRTVPADLHERRLDHCKRLLEELKHQYSMETERKTEQVAKLQEQMKVIEDKYQKICQEHEAVKEELKAALKNVKLYRKAAVIFRQRVKAAAARATKVRRSARNSRSSNEPLRQALSALEKIKREIKLVKSRAYTSLEELERRIVEQERRAAAAQAEYRRELERASLALEHKEGIIRSLIDKVADVEEVRLSQINTQRLQGIVTDSDRSASPKERKDKPAKLVPGHGGYFQEREGKKRTK